MPSSVPGEGATPSPRQSDPTPDGPASSSHRSTRAGAGFPDCGSRIRSSERSAPGIWGAPSTGRRSPDRAPSSSRTSGSIQRFSKPGQRERRAPSTTGTPASTPTPPQWRPSKRMIDMRIRARDRRDSSGMPAMDAIRRIAEESGAHRERVPGSTWAVVGVHAAHRMAPPVPTAMRADDGCPAARALEGVLRPVRLASSVSRSGSRRS